MTQRIPENFFAAEWRLVTIMGQPPRDLNDEGNENNDTEPDDERQPSENPTKTNKREGSCNSSPALISVRRDNWLH